MRVLIIEDDPDIGRQLLAFLRHSGFQPHLERSGIEGRYQGDVQDWDMVLLDIGLPDLDGLTILQHWRNAGRSMPVLLLTARTAKIDTIRGLEFGADDYIHKPFDLEELGARIRAHLRRHKQLTGNRIKFRNVVLDLDQSRFQVDGVNAALTRTEYLLLQYLFVNRGRPVAIGELVEHIYSGGEADPNLVARHIANIRKKIGAEIIHTESNRGYLVPADD
jgi:two-component system, OmpR family, response regulator